MANLTIYGAALSTYVRTVRLLLEEAGAEYDLKEVGIFNGENTSAEYLAKKWLVRYLDHLKLIQSPSKFLS